MADYPLPARGFSLGLCTREYYDERNILFESHERPAPAAAQIDTTWMHQQTHAWR